MSQPSISFLVPTAGRPEIECALASLVPQLQDGDEVLVLGDTTDGPLEQSQEIVASFGQPYRWIDCQSREHTWGHAEINHGIAQAKGDLIHVNDDDDIWTEGAANVMRRAAAEFPGRPLLFRFLSWHSLVFWDRQGMLAQDHVGGHCLVAPNIPGMVGEWGLHYQGDFSYILRTVSLHGGIDSVIWRNELVALARPAIEVRRMVLEAAGRLVVS